jgi:hypothetical protein
LSELFNQAFPKTGVQKSDCRLNHDNAVDFLILAWFYCHLHKILPYFLTQKKVPWGCYFYVKYKFSGIGRQPLD